MIRIKIISNPYRKETRFERWDEESDQWNEITFENNPSSKLLSKEIMNREYIFKNTI